MQVSQGKAISEYALIGALVVLVAIPAVVFLGNVISLGTDTNAAEVEAGAERLVGLMGTSQSDPYADVPMPGGGMTTDGAGSLPASPPSGSAGLSDNGVLTLPDGSTTTSAEGTTELVSDILASIVASGQLLDGTPLDDAQQQALDKLSKDLNKLAKEQGQFLGNTDSDGHWNSVATHNNKAVETMETDVTAAFTGDPAYDQVLALMGLVTNGSEQISQLTDDDNAAGDLKVYGDAAPGVTDENVPGFTQAASEAIATGNY